MRGFMMEHRRETHTSRTRDDGTVSGMMGDTSAVYSETNLSSIGFSVFGFLFPSAFMMPVFPISTTCVPFFGSRNGTGVVVVFGNRQWAVNTHADLMLEIQLLLAAAGSSLFPPKPIVGRIRVRMS